MKNYKDDFPIFKQKVGGKNLVYLDSGATSQKPQRVLDAISSYYETYNANAKRGLYPIAEKATVKVEQVREKVASFINAKSDEIIFVRNATEGLNLIAYSYARNNVTKDDVLISTVMEHHANFVPWQIVAKEKQAQFQMLDINEKGELIYAPFAKAKILCVTYVSNVLGTINPMKEIIASFKKQNPKGVVVVDAAQAVGHMTIDVKALNCDFLVFSGHKMFAGMGVGVVYGKKHILEQMKPFLYGGEMIREVRLSSTTFAPVPHKFEAGTLDVADIVSLGEAIDYITSIGVEKIANYEKELLVYSYNKLTSIKGVTILGPSLQKRGGILSFTLDGVHPHDAAHILGRFGVCVRAGHHCAMPLHEKLSLTASIRASLHIYNDKEDIDSLVKGLRKVKEIFKV